MTFCGQCSYKSYTCTLLYCAYYRKMLLCRVVLIGACVEHFKLISLLPCLPAVGSQGKWRTQYLYSKGSLELWRLGRECRCTKAQTALYYDNLNTVGYLWTGTGQRLIRIPADEELNRNTYLRESAKVLFRSRNNSVFLSWLLQKVKPRL
jgi:hypothetical protein